jgi:2Fe-2S ferredoxin
MSEITVIFITPDKKEVPCSAKVGMSVLDVAHQNKDKFFLEGACEGSLACSTCHVILESDQYKEFPEATEDEEDMLDLAFDVKPTSRLGCQLIITENMNGFKFHLPSNTRNNT